MKKQLLLVVFFSLLTGFYTHAQFTLATDNAGNYGGTWGNGSNYGSGFNAWSISYGANTGTFIGNPANNGMGTTGIGTTAFALYATGTSYCNANRTFDALQWNDKLSFYWAMNWDANSSGSKGFDIKANNTTVFNVNNGGSATISCTNGVIDNTYGTNPMFVEITRTGETSYEFKMTKRTDGSTYTTTFTSANPVNEIGIYIGGQNDGAGQRNIYFNHFEITNSGAFNIPSGSTTYSKILTGSGSITKTGNGTLILTGNNDYNGSTTISAGTLQYGDGTNIASSFSSDIENNSSLVFNVPENEWREFAHEISGSGSLTKLGGGKLYLSGVQTYEGNTTVSQGELWLYTNLAYGTVTVESGAVLHIDYEGATVNDLVINSGGKLIVGWSEALLVYGDLTNNGAIELQNMTSNGSSGSLIVEGEISGTGTFKYNLTVEGSTDWGSWNTGWHFLSSPVASQAISAFATTGDDNDYDFYGYHEPTRQWINYKEEPDDDPKFSIWNGANFVVGRGYFVSYQANQYGLEFTGAINHSNITLSNLTETESAGKGWHLLGNPFPSAIEWNNGDWALTNVAGTAKIWDSEIESYTDLAASEVIPAAQGFFIQVEESTNSLTIPLSARIHATGSWYKSDDNLAVKLSARPVDGSSAQASLIRIHPEASENFDFYYDSRFIPGGAPLLYSLTEGERLSTNTLPSLSNGQEILYGFEKNEHSDFAIELIENNTGMPVYLTDFKTGTTTEISQNPVYTFTAAAGDNPNRFKLTFGSVGIEQPVAQSIRVYTSENMLYLLTGGNAARVEVFSLTGQKLMDVETRSNTLPLNITSGIYLVKVTTSGQTHVQKIIVK